MSLRQEYMKERRKLQNKMSRYRRKGVFYKSTSYVLPTIPKKITQGSINRLKKINEEFVEKAIKVNPETGEIIPYKTAKVIERREREKTKKQQRQFKKELEQYIEVKREQAHDREQYRDITSDIIDELYNRHIMNHAQDRPGTEILKSWWNNTRTEMGDKAFALQAEEWASKGIFEDLLPFDSSDFQMARHIALWLFKTNIPEKDMQTVFDEYEELEEENPFL